MDDYRVVVVHFRLRRACSAAGGNRLPTGRGSICRVVRGAGVKAELANEPDDDAIELVLQVFADLEGGRRVVAHPDDEPAQLVLGLKNVSREQRSTFVKLHLREAYLDPVSGDPTAWRALIAALGDEGASCGVATLRARPFAVELGPRLIRALD